MQFIGEFISIPKWSDFSQSYQIPPLTDASISIPKWSDFSLKEEISLRPLTEFQSQNGLILVYIYKPN